MDNNEPANQYRLQNIVRKDKITPWEELNSDARRKWRKRYFYEVLNDGS